ncbi:uncharacterized protein dbf4b [Dunckerocampus dactyliophorus]|uniref:uncharacterized protein dbf4b n=1 Tax=Dunckerocampus dactyliophorus TaxID=161453 RepID=UPI0024049E05|nr:uncharacterized protein dbf4b [Dunckerocampus dactyliophorus]XP_054623678.1 uncharacterized protein dbf4b [Dunckerocampus dactyliophorus]XP_054623679.1 uncharacterized protein dbf4b [Dunckerocampus dactyliophorus]
MLQQQCAEQLELLGKLCPGEKKLEGKTFYLDNVKKRLTTLLLEAISLLGGSIESFLHRDVSFVVTGSQAGLEEQKTKKNDETQRTVKQQQSVMCSEKQPPATPRPTVCGSRGKALLEKAIRNNERVQGSSVLANARSWGMKILHVDDVLLYLKQLNSEFVSAKPKRPERTSNKQPSSHVVKATSLRSPFVKIEDTSRKYKPLLMQSMTFPSLCYLGRFSPFEPPPPPRFDKQLSPGGNKSRPKSKVESSSKDKSQTPSPWLPRKKNLSYCECCMQSFSNLEEHLQSDQHRVFVLESSNYSVLDCLVVEMVPRFDICPEEEVFYRTPASIPIQDLGELELTDAEMQPEVWALREQTQICGPDQDPPLQVQPSKSPDSPIPNPAASPSIIHQLSSDHDSLPCPSTLTTAVLEVVPQPQLLSPSHDPSTQDPYFDPFSLPPVLSPQVLSLDDMELHSPYSEPPVLSPQNYTTEDYGDMCDNIASVSETVPILSCAHPIVAVELSKPDAPPVVSKVQCPYSFLESFKLSTCQQWTPKLRKRCRHSSPECSQSKRKRTASGGCGKDIVNSLSDMASCQILQKCSSGNVPLLDRMRHVDKLDSSVPQSFPPFNILPSWPLSSHPANPSSYLCNDQAPDGLSSRGSQQSQSHSTSVCIDPALIPDVDRLSLSSSDSDWDCELLSGLRPIAARSASPAAQTCELDKDILHRPCAWMHDTSYESRLHTVLQPSTPAGEPSTFSRTVVQIVEVQH